MSNLFFSEMKYKLFTNAYHFYVVGVIISF